MSKTEAILEAIRRANPDKNGDLLRILRELNPDAASEIENIARRSGSNRNNNSR